MEEEKKCEPTQSRLSDFMHDPQIDEEIAQAQRRNGLLSEFQQQITQQESVMREGQTKLAVAEIRNLYDEADRERMGRRLDAIVTKAKKTQQSLRETVEKGEHIVMSTDQLVKQKLRELKQIFKQTEREMKESLEMQRLRRQIGPDAPSIQSHVEKVMVGLSTSQMK